TIVPNVQAKVLAEENISLFEYISSDTALWIKDVQFTLDVVAKGFKKAVELWNALLFEDRRQNPEWIDPRNGFIDEKSLSVMLRDFAVVEFGKQFFYPETHAITFNQRPQPSFNKDFSLLIHNLKENEQAGIHNTIFSDSPKQIERIITILADLDKSVTFTPVHIGLREGFADADLQFACYTDHQIFDRYYKYKRRRGYERSQAITLKELRELKPGDYITHIDHGIGKYAGLEKVEVNGKMQEMIRLVYADN